MTLRLSRFVVRDDERDAPLGAAAPPAYGPHTDANASDDANPWANKPRRARAIPALAYGRPLAPAHTRLLEGGGA